MPALSHAAREAALVGFGDDVATVIAHVLADTAAYPNTETMDALLAALRAGEFPLLRVLARIVAWVCFTMRWRARHRHLTDEEQQINAAAWRLSDALHGPRHH